MSRAELHGREKRLMEFRLSCVLEIAGCRVRDWSPSGDRTNCISCLGERLTPLHHKGRGGGIGRVSKFCLIVSTRIDAITKSAARLVFNAVRYCVCSCFCLAWASISFEIAPKPCSAILLNERTCLRAALFSQQSFFFVCLLALAFILPMALWNTRWVLRCLVQTPTQTGRLLTLWELVYRSVSLSLFFFSFFCLSFG